MNVSGLMCPLVWLARLVVCTSLVFVCGSLASGCGGNGEIDLGDLDSGGQDATLDAPSGDASSDAGRQDATILDGAVDAQLDAGRVGTPGCIDGAGASSGEVTFTLEDLERRYLLYLPEGYNRDQQWPLVFALHGNGGSVSYWNSTTGERNIRGAVQNEAILVVAEAIEGNWRDYADGHDPWPPRIEMELRYFDKILDDLSNQLCIDPNAIFTMGFSGGGSFSGVLGCRRDYIRALAAGGSVIYFEAEDCVQAPAAWVTMGAMELEQRGTTFRDHFLGAAACSDDTQPTDPSPCVAYQGCADDAPIEYCVHPGGHVWPDFGTAATWAFFKQFVQ